jgi:SSS family solute:Na+ symporter
MNPFFTLGIVILYFIVLLIISAFTSRKADNNSFFIGNRVSPWYVVAFGMIGASLSGVTFISVPGWVLSSKFYYMQMVFGYLLGYAAIVHILLPVYYRLKLTSIYTYLETRFGRYAYKTGASFFLLSRLIGASFRLYIIANVLHLAVFEQLHLPFIITIVITLCLIYLYTFRGGIKTIVWTDTLQTLFLLTAVIVSIIFLIHQLELPAHKMVPALKNSGYADMFNFSRWRESSFFVKQFISGAFITIVMTGLDQDMMQKNLSCRNLRDAQKNMYWYSTLLIPVNLLFLTLGVLLVLFIQQQGIGLPQRSDDLFPMLATGYFPPVIGVVFILGLIAAAYSSADSALTALTTSFTLDILDARKLSEQQLKKLRRLVHVAMSVAIGLLIFFFRSLNNDAVIDSLFKAAGYTYGPLLGLFTYGIFTKKNIRDTWVPIIAVLSPVLSFLVKTILEKCITAYQSGYEILLINGLITIAGLVIISKRTG